ncbi:MAG: glycosyltransferase family 9 protein [Vicinamibacteria bacterium]
MLKRGGARVTLLAPESSGTALLGPGPSEADALLSWDHPSLAPLLAGERPRPSPLADALRRHDAAILYSRSGPLASALSALVPRVLAHDPAPRGPEHAADWYAKPALALVGPESAGPAEPTAPAPRDPPDAREAPPPDLVFTEGERASAAEQVRDLPAAFLALHPGSGSPRKNWPEQRFAALAASASAGRPWLLVLGPAEAGARLARAGGARVLRAPARVVAAVLARAGAYVGNDSGVSHLAAAAGAPTLALFGPTDPALWAPLGRHVATLRARDRRIEALGVEQVRAALARLPGQGGGR